MFKPLQDRVLVSRINAMETTKSGLFIPATAQERPNQGKVMSVGSGFVMPDGKVRPLDIKVGDTVLFPKFSGTEVTVNGEELLILKESEILGIM